MSNAAPVPAPVPPHPADGLYTLSEADLRRRGACLAHRDLWVRHYGAAPAPVTLAMLVAHARRADGEGLTTGLGWLLWRMRDGHQLTSDEYNVVLRNYAHAYTIEKDARAVFDGLLLRARRERRLP